MSNFYPPQYSANYAIQNINLNRANPNIKNINKIQSDERLHPSKLYSSNNINQYNKPIILNPPQTPSQLNQQLPQFKKSYTNTYTKPFIHPRQQILEPELQPNQYFSKEDYRLTESMGMQMPMSMAFQAPQSSKYFENSNQVLPTNNYDDDNLASYGVPRDKNLPNYTNRTIPDFFIPRPADRKDDYMSESSNLEYMSEKDRYNLMSNYNNKLN